MKHMKKLVSVLLTMVMVFAMTATVFAEGDTYTITAPDNGHTYEVYQIFTGDLSGKVLSNVKWGKNGTGTQGEAVSDAILKELEDASGSDTNKLAVITKYVNLNSEKFGTVTNDIPLENVPAGYYLIKDKDDSLAGKDDAYTTYIVNVVGNVTITPKTGVPTVEKKVKDTNDSVADSTTGWQDSADYDIGDTIPYQLTATMGDLSHFDHYYVEFVDTMTNLTYTGITSVKVGDRTLTEAQYSVNWDATSKTLKVIILDVKAYDATTGTQVVVEYTATLDNDANIGSAGNPNEVYLIFSNNPNNTGDGTAKPGDTGETPKDKNIVFTYKVTANKVTSDKQALKGAAFELFKKNASGVYESLGVVGATKEGDTYIADENTIDKFSWTGIDDGDYKLVEVVTPEGYNTIDPIEFTVSATHDETADNPTLITLTGGDRFTGEVSTGELSADIVNLTGTELPETGGMGTTIFYVLGSILVLGAAVLLITRKRMGAQR